MNTQLKMQRQLNQLRRFAAHLVLTLVIVLGLTWGIEERGLTRDIEWLIPAAVLLFIAHTLWLVYRETAHYIIEQAQQTETESDKKPKRDQHFVLSDDGELVEMMDEKEKHAQDYR